MGTYWVNGGIGIDLKSVHVVSRVLEQAIVRVEHVVAE